MARMDVVFRKNDKAVPVKEFVSALEEYLSENYRDVKVDFNIGRKYVKFIVDGSGSRSVYCFLDSEGNIYRPASWKAPSTKHIRGNIVEDDNYSLRKGLGPYGTAYMK